MSANDPLLYTKSPDELMQTIVTGLERTGWQPQKASTGAALVQLFGRLSQIVIHRLNQIPRQHFRTFLNAAGIDRLPPRAATTELTFTPAPDAPSFILVPQGTQVATRPTETQPELVFETEQALVAVPAALTHCLVIDPVNYRNCTAIATGQQTGAFAAWQGTTERTRILYIGHDTLFGFADEASRRHGTVTLAFTFVNSDNAPPAQWQVQWLYWDGEQWAELGQVAGVQIEDKTANLCQDGVVEFRQLPKLLPSSLKEITSVWLAARLTGGDSRANLPTVRTVTISRTITLPDQQAVTAKIDHALATIQAGSTFFPLDAQGPAFLPLGPHPMPLDAFYLQVDEAFAKRGAQVTMTLALDELSDKLAELTTDERPKIAWEYFSTQGWTLLGESWLGCPELAKRNYDDPAFGLPVPTLQTQPFTRSKYLEFRLDAGETPPVLPPALAGGTVVTDIYTGANYGQIPVPERWAPSPDFDLIHGAYSAESSEPPLFSFRDKTCALTTAGLVQFVIPNGSTAKAPLFAPTIINGQTGYWVRARLVSGTYAVRQPAPNLWQGLVAKAWLPTQTYPPVVQGVQITYCHYANTTPVQPLERCQSRVDQQWRDHVADLRDERAFQPFTSQCEEAALYLGFLHLDRSSPKPAFPAGQLLSLRIAVAERTAAALQAAAAFPKLEWAYWNGRQWAPLRTLDGTADFCYTGDLQFYTPADHASSEEFGEAAYWLRASRQSSATPNATPNTSALAMPYLESLRLNTVTAINAETIHNEIVRLRSDSEGEHYLLARAPVLPASLYLEIFEPDQRNERSLAAAATPGVTATTTAATGAWVPWTQVATFHDAQPDSRVYRLDPSSGELSFGHGEQGRALPPGVDHVRATRYRTHRGAAGNVAANTIRVLRNATGDVAAVQRVGNGAAAVGGADVETVTEAEERGPQRLKNRQRAVTVDDFAWLAREVEGVAQAYCLPTRDAQGQTKPGWVTMVIMPKPGYAVAANGDRPVPTPALLQQVRTYLEARMLTNLTTVVAPNGQPLRPIAARHLLVQGPTYLEVAVHAEVALRAPTTLPQIRPALIAQLDAFLHPTHGGPDRQGWAPGRDVYPSEVAAEIEQVPGVDYVTNVRLQGASLQQQRLTVTGTQLRWPLPAGSQVSSFDEQCKLRLGAPLAQGATPTELLVYAYKQGDAVTLTPTASSLPSFTSTVAQLANQGFTLFFDQPFTFADDAQFAAWQKAAPLLTANDQRLALSMQPYLYRRDKLGRIALYGALIFWSEQKVAPPVSAIAANLNAGGGVNLARSGQPGPDPAKPRLVHAGANGWPVRFAEPLVFTDGAKFLAWLKAQPALTTDDQTLRLPICVNAHPELAGVITLPGVLTRPFQTGDQVSLTAPTRRTHRVDFWPVHTAAIEQTVDRLFVPDDTLVCAGEHVIEPASEA